MLANITKLNVTKNIYEICRLAHDITGGFIAIAMSEADFRTRRSAYVEKFPRPG